MHFQKELHEFVVRFAWYDDLSRSCYSKIMYLLIFMEENCVTLCYSLLDLFPLLLPTSNIIRFGYNDG